MVTVGAFPRAEQPDRKGELLDAHRQRGAALIIALVTLLIVTMSILVAASFVQVRLDAFRAEERRVMTTALADAAMAETLAHLDEDQNFVGSRARAFDKGTISSSVEKNRQDFRSVTAAGRFAGWQTVIEAEVDIRFARVKVVSWKYRHGPI